MGRIAYLDNAATTYPKPSVVLEATIDFTRDVGANPGRSGHRLSVEAGRHIEDTREAVAELFHITDSLRIAFMQNATYALNTALIGLLHEGDHVVTTSMEHNSIARPLRFLEQERGIRLTIVPVDPTTSLVDPEDISTAMRDGCRLIAIIHGSNVSGAIQPIPTISTIAHDHGALLLVDAAQTAGTYPIDVKRDGIDLLAFTGHKGLYGPQGTGGLYVRPGIDLPPLCHGGTGSRSEHDRQPTFLPDALEAGTPNTHGLVGLGAGVRWVAARGVADIHRDEAALSQRLRDGLTNIDGVRLVGAVDPMESVPVTSIVVDDLTPSDIGQRLDEEFDVMVRVGLCCAPWAHHALGTFPDGTIRFSLSAFTTTEEIDRAIDAVRTIVERA